MDNDADLENFFSFVLLFAGACLSSLFQKKLEPHLDKALDVIYISYGFTVFAIRVTQIVSSPNNPIGDVHKM
ncbi:5801_t:CDS:2 [Entrophospora sp. SA101]|nr:5801_t:CDS:2 [Entrophospora sp. SA101]